MTAIYKWKQLGNLLLMVATSGEISPDDLEATNALHRTDQVTRGLMFALGNPSMSPASRKRVAAAMRDHPGVVVTDSTIARGVITAMNWLGNPMRAFSPSRVKDAIAAVGLPASYTEDAVLRELERLKQEVARARAS